MIVHVENLKSWTKTRFFLFTHLTPFPCFGVDLASLSGVLHSTAYMNDHIPLFLKVTFALNRQD